MQNRAIPGKTQTATGREFGHGMGYSWKKLSRWREGTGLREFPGVMKKKHGNFHDMSLGISDGCHTILPNFLGRWKLVFSRISKGKVTNLKTPKGKQGGGRSEKYILDTPTHPPPALVWLGCWFFWNSPISPFQFLVPSENFYASFAYGMQSLFSI